MSTKGNITQHMQAFEFAANITAVVFCDLEMNDWRKDGPSSQSNFSIIFGSSIIWVTRRVNLAAVNPELFLKKKKQGTFNIIRGFGVLSDGKEKDMPGIGENHDFVV
ncbi:hypothetical protein AVEN_266160-1 [Araneus ventricosus]|uniref:Uncharacterized protein n=1 Tax=Araneus ventricosus TaxID=182803 RepID=A0A4Y2UIB5_ARAVE|nr:hypothetical protein AVEN_7301-1 [Araneus ventricosus]GBO11353.1 hypothetical protein AVEN_266160-1 [Araneus ventricosus]